jgi:hypothetical protein
VLQGFALAFEARFAGHCLAGEKFHRPFAENQPIATLVTQPSEDFVACHPESPSAEIAAWPEAIELFPKYDRDLLHDVIGIGPRRDKTANERSNRCLVASELA